jgi:hypothetical protein
MQPPAYRHRVGNGGGPAWPRPVHSPKPPGPDQRAPARPLGPQVYRSSSGAESSGRQASRSQLSAEGRT